MKPLRYIFASLASIFLILALLIASVEYWCFVRRDYWSDTYEKEKSYETIGMTLDDLIHVSEHMMDYVQGKYDELTYITTIKGERRDFFNEREKLHMVDVQALNLNAVHFMRICFELTVLFAMLMLAICFKYAEKRKARQLILKTLSAGMLIGAGTMIVIVGIGAIIATRDFDAFWRQFHHVFFSGNDLWLLDPNTDMLINMTTETLFAGLVARIALTFASVLLILLILSTIYLLRTHKKAKKSALALILVMFMLPKSTPFADDNIVSLPDPPSITAEHAILMDGKSGQILYAKSAKDPAYPASTTKVMTALLTLENLSLSDTVTFSKNAIYSLTKGASHIGMTPGEVLTVEDCLYGLLLPSANEVANALAEKVSGNISDFVALMNTRAASLGCENTTFANANGLHDENHKTSAFDLALIFKACISLPSFIAIDSSVTHVISPTNLVAESRPMRTTHKMLIKDSGYFDERVICGKTGHTPEAGGCLITYAENGGRSLICVVLHSEEPNEYTDTSLLLDYGFERFSQIGSKLLSKHFFSLDGSIYKFAKSEPLSLYQIESGDLYLLPTDLDVIDWSMNDGYIHMSTGTLDLGTLKCTSTGLENTFLTNGLLPVEKHARLQIELPPPKWPLILLIVIASLLVVSILIILVMRSRFAVSIRKKKNTKIIKNPGTKNIKIK